MGNFLIKKTTEYLPKRNVELNIDSLKSLKSNVQKIESSNEIVVLDKARKSMFDHIGWGQDVKNNSVEQGGILIGHSYREDDVTVGVVKYAIPAFLAKGSMAYLEFGHDAWKSMVDELDNLNESLSEDEMQVIGWYHTHPGRLSVFMSGTDRNTQAKMFYQDWQFAIVLNPQKKVWRAFSGCDSKECLGQIKLGD